MSLWRILMVLCATAVVAGAGSAARAGDYAYFGGYCYRYINAPECFRDAQRAIYHNQNLIAHLEANPATDDGIKGALRWCNAILSVMTTLLCCTSVCEVVLEAAPEGTYEETIELGFVWCLLVACNSANTRVRFEHEHGMFCDNTMRMREHTSAVQPKDTLWVTVPWSQAGARGASSILPTSSIGAARARPSPPRSSTLARSRCRR